MHARFQNKPFAFGMILFALFCMLAIFVSCGMTDSTDKMIIRFIYQLRGNHSNPQGIFYWTNRLLTELGYVYVLVPACVLALIVGKGKLNVLFLSLGTGIVWLINYLIKLIFVRERPDVIYRMMEETSASFPSGHAMTSAFFYFFFAYLICKSNIRGKAKCALITCSILLPFVIGITRVNLSVHYLTDVLAGLLLGGAFVCFAVVWLEHLQKNRNCL